MTYDIKDLRKIESKKNGCGNDFKQLKAADYEWNLLDWSGDESHRAIVQILIEGEEVVISAFPVEEFRENGYDSDIVGFENVMILTGDADLLRRE